MDVSWLGLIIPLAYYSISLFFLCFPNLLCSRQRYQCSILNDLIDSDKVLCIGHRGGGFEGPQNTMQVFKKNEKHSHMFQLDVRLTKDGQLVVIHDDTLLRTCGVDLAVETMDYKDLPPFKEEYMSFGNGLMKSEVNRIPRLDDVFREFPDKLMNIQLKSSNERAIHEFDRLVRLRSRQDITIWGIAGSTNEQLREINPAVVNFYSAGEVFRIFLLCITGLLPFVCLRQGVLDIPLITDDLIAFASQFNIGCCRKCLFGFAMLILRFFNLISRLFIPHLKKRGILTFYFILNSTVDFDTAVSMGCSGIMTDETNKLAEYLRNKKIYYRGNDSF